MNIILFITILSQRYFRKGGGEFHNVLKYVIGMLKRSEVNYKHFIKDYSQ